MMKDFTLGFNLLCLFVYLWFVDLNIQPDPIPTTNDVELLAIIELYELKYGFLQLNKGFRVNEL